MTVSRMLLILLALFPISEVALAVMKRAKSAGGGVDDRGSLRVLWVTIGLSVGAAVAARSLQLAPLPGSVHSLSLLALLLTFVGLAIRWTAIVTLGRYFTVDVAAQAQQPVIQTGVYRFVRHPSYSGLLLIFAGQGVHFSNWISLLVLMVPISVAVMNRIAKEEAVLRKVLGDEYVSYCARTRRLVPGLL